MTGHQFNMSLPPRLAACALCSCKLASPAADQRCPVAFPNATPSAMPSPRYPRPHPRVRHRAPASRRKRWDDAPEVPTWWDSEALEQAKQRPKRRNFRYRRCGRDQDARTYHYAGLRMKIVEWARVTTIPYTVLFYRYAAGWNARKALCKPVERRKRSRRSRR